MEQCIKRFICFDARTQTCCCCSHSMKKINVTGAWCSRYTNTQRFLHRKTQTEKQNFMVHFCFVCCVCARCGFVSTFFGLQKNRGKLRYTSCKCIYPSPSRFRSIFGLWLHWRCTLWFGSVFRILSPMLTEKLLRNEYLLGARNVSFSFWLWWLFFLFSSSFSLFNPCAVRAEYMHKGRSLKQSTHRNSSSCIRSARCTHTTNAYAARACLCLPHSSMHIHLSLPPYVELFFIKVVKTQCII